MLNRPQKSVDAIRVWQPRIARGIAIFHSGSDFQLIFAIVKGCFPPVKQPAAEPWLQFNLMTDLNVHYFINYIQKVTQIFFLCTKYLFTVRTKMY